MSTRVRHAIAAIHGLSGGSLTIRILSLLLLIAGSRLAWSQPSSALTMKVTYVTSDNVYFSSGSDEGVMVGDTVAILRSGSEIGTAVVSMLAVHSSVAHIAVRDSLFHEGDICVLRRGGKPIPRPSSGTADTTIAASTIAHGEGPAGISPTPPAENRIRGRIAIQYFGEIAEDTRLNLQEPAIATTLSMANIAGTGMNLSLNARGVTDFTNAYTQFGTGNKSRISLYDFRLSMDRPADHFGFMLGRMVSGYVGSLGLLDGGQVFVRESGIVAGAIAGRSVGQSALAINGGQVKSAVFVGYQDQAGGTRDYEGTIAYARQTLNGSLDRQFMAFQGSAFLGSSFQAFGNADLELNGIHNGQKTSSASLSGASLFLNYSYAWWLSGSVSYDESRPIYLFETMKSIPDSLFDEALQHGFRLSLTVRPAKDLALSGSAGYRFRQGDARPSHTLSGSVRAYDAFETGVNATVRYTGAIGPFLTGNDATVELDRMLFRNLDVTLRYDHYAFGIDVLHQVYLTQTFSLDTQYRFSRRFYGILRGDYILDNTMNSIRFQFELGLWL